jgi:hypothetical protein
MLCSFPVVGRGCDIPRGAGVIATARTAAPVKAAAAPEGLGLEGRAALRAKLPIEENVGCCHLPRGNDRDPAGAKPASREAGFGRAERDRA